MASFRHKTISRGQTLADKFSKARLEQDISLAEAQEATKIQSKYLEILESGDWEKLPGDIYAKAWIRLYADFLGLEVSGLLTDYKIEKSMSSKLVRINQPIKRRDFSRYNILKPRILKLSAIAILVLALLGYLGWELNNIIRPPSIFIAEPGNNFKTSDNSVVIKGHTEPEVTLTINHELVLLDGEGNFSETINLVIGLNNLEINAKKKHSKTNNLELVILREDLSNNNF